jgi:hypothetical protein
VTAIPNEDPGLPPFLALAGDEPFTDAELDEVLSTGLDVPEGHPLARVTAWRIESDEDAEWAMRKLVEVVAEREPIDLQHDEWVRRIEANRKALVEPLSRRQARWELLLEDYVLRVRDASAGKVKSIKLPSGKLATTGSDEAVELADEEAVLAWVNTLPEPERAELLSKPKPLVSALRKRAGIVEQHVVETRFKARLFCEHLVGMRTEDPFPDAPWKAGDEVPCETCGTRQRVELVEIETEELATKVVLDTTTGEPIPGVTIRPPKVTPRVEVIR